MVCNFWLFLVCDGIGQIVRESYLKDGFRYNYSEKKILTYTPLKNGLYEMGFWYKGAHIASLAQTPTLVKMEFSSRKIGGDFIDLYLYDVDKDGFVDGLIVGSPEKYLGFLCVQINTKDFYFPEHKKIIGFSDEINTLKEDDFLNFLELWVKQGKSLKGKKSIIFPSNISTEEK